MNIILSVYNLDIFSKKLYNCKKIFTNKNNFLIFVKEKNVKLKKISEHDSFVYIFFVYLQVLLKNLKIGIFPGKKSSELVSNYLTVFLKKEEPQISEILSKEIKEIINKKIKSITLLDILAEIFSFILLPSEPKKTRTNKVNPHLLNA